uniref:Uncharacterized protein n=1 Tax=Palpitomonas bilix TaxID=652834 RepID=A0A7S3DLM4_9EUKA
MKRNMGPCYAWRHAVSLHVHVLDDAVPGYLWYGNLSSWFSITIPLKDSLRFRALVSVHSKCVAPPKQQRQNQYSFLFWDIVSPHLPISLPSCNHGWASFALLPPFDK